MPHTYVSCDCHCVFAVKERGQVLNVDIRERLFRFFNGVAKKYGMHLVAAGGVEDHVHLLINLPATMSISSAMKLIKGSSARWIHKTYPEATDFSWQEGYAAFSVSRSHRSRTVAYIANQVIHHQGQSYEEELKAFLGKHSLLYQPD